MKQNQLYLLASFSSLIAFIISIFYLYKHKLNNSQNMIILILGLLALSKSIEYYEKHIFKLSHKH